MVAPYYALVKVAEVHGEGKTDLGSFGRVSFDTKLQLCLEVPDGGRSVRVSISQSLSERFRRLAGGGGRYDLSARKNLYALAEN